MITRRKFLSTVALGATALIAGCQGIEGLPSETTQKKPNIVLFLVDDLGWADVGCNGTNYYETPNIDKLAKEGVKFTNAYANPVCSPSRASLMTGKYSGRLRLTGAIMPDRFIPKDRKLLSPNSLKNLPLEEFTIAEALKEEGYTTASIGKWHLGGYPTDHGFDINIAGNHWGQPTNYFAPFNKNRRTGKLINRKYPNLRKAKTGEHLSDVLTDHAMDFIETNKDKPFFLDFNFYSVHSPIQAKKDLIKKYKGKTPDHDDRIPEYAAMIETMDTNIGKVLGKLKELNIEDNTIIVFMSDNGGCYNNAPLRGKKGQLYEGGIKEPLIIKWNKVTKPNSICETPVIINDFYPTFLAMAGAKQRPNQHIDGINLTPLLKGEKEINREALFWYYPHHSKWEVYKVPVAAVRKGDWKLIHFMESEKYELYNLKDDIGEKNNLIIKNPSKANELKDLLINWKKDVKVLEPKINPNFKGKNE